MAESIATVSSIGREDADQVRALHRALDALGFRLGEEEQKTGIAGRTTLLAVRAIERAAGLVIDERVVLSAAAAAEINRRLAASGTLAGPAGGPAEALLVVGSVKGSDGVPMTGFTVQAFDQDLRERQLLGSATTDRTGEYAIAYHPDQFARAEKGYADIVVEVTPPGARKPVYESAILFNAPRRLVHDVRLLARGPSLHERLLAAIQPVLEGQKVGLAEVEENDRFRDVSFLAGETGFEAAEISAVGVAARLECDIQLDARMLFALLMSGVWPEPMVGPAFEVGSLEARAAGIRRRLGEPSTESLRSALATSVARGTITASPKEIDAFIERFAAFAARDGGGATLSPNLLRQLMGRDAAKIEPHLAAGGGAGLLSRLSQDKKVSPELRRRVEGIVALDSATVGDRDLVFALAGLATSADQVGALARMDSQGWSKLLKRTGVKEVPAYVRELGGDGDRYAELLTARFRSLYPTQAFIGDVLRDKKAPAPAGALAALIDEDPAVDFAAISLDRYAAARGGKRGARRETLAEAAQALKPMQRLYKVAPDYAAVSALARHGMGSAQAVYRRGEDAVVEILSREAGMTERSARLAYDRASATAAASLQLMLGVAAEAEMSGVPVMSGLAEEASAVPELASLFALGNDCACTECSSVLSPAAYLADLMLFLSSRELGTGRDAKDVLLSRRPDIAWVDLNCPNAFTPLPYVDLAIEAMEDLVAPFKVGALTAAQRATLPTDNADHPIPAAVVAAFAAFTAPVVLGSAARVRKAGSDWVLRDAPLAFRIQPTGGTADVLVLRNTHGSAQERELISEYTNPKASAALALKTFPWTLPLDAAGAETALSLTKLGVDRDELMRTLRGPAAPNSPNGLDIAAARLGLTSDVATLIVTPAANPSTHWGASTVAQAVTRYTPVPAFLAATGLDYADLLRLLSLPFPNPGGALAIQHLDESCDLAAKNIVTLDAPSLDRLHRFLRLTRALAMPLADADLMVRAFGAGGGLATAADLIAIADASRVRSLLGDIPVDELVALFKPIPVDDRFDLLHEPPLPSLYRRLFLDPLVHRPVSPAFEVAAVSAASPAAQMADHRSAILAGLQIASADLDLLLPPAGPALPLSLSNLSSLYRHARVARALNLPISEWLVFSRLVGGNPFDTPAALIRAIELVRRAQALELDPAALADLLEAGQGADALPAATAGEALAALRSDLQAIDADTAPPAPDSDRQSLIERLPAALAPLDADPDRAGRIAEIAQNAFVARVEIAPAPAAAYTPSAGVSDLPFTATIDGARMVLAYTGLMGPAAKALLTNAAEAGPIATDPDWIAAIDSLEQQPRLPIATVSTRFEAPLAAWPAGLALPAPLKRRIRYVPVRRTVQFDGIMTPGERTALNAASADPAWAAAVTSLFDQPRANPVPAGQRLADFAAWQFPDPADDEETADGKVRANLIAMLAVLLPKAREAASKDAVVSAISALTGLDRDSAHTLISRIVLAGTSLLGRLTDRPGFVNTSGPVIPSAMLPQFQAAELAHRSARIAAAFRMGAKELDLVLTLADAANSDLLHPATLPPAYGPPAPPPPAPPALSPLERLIRLGELLLLDRKTARKPNRLLELMVRILADPASVTLGPGASTLDLLAAAEAMLGWSSADVGALAAPGAGLGLAYPQDFRNAQAWLRLGRALAVIRRTGLPAADALKLAGATPTGTEAALARQAMRARLGTQFAVAARQVQDNLRELRRDALCDYILNYVQPGTGGLPASPTGGWTKATDVFAYLLIDPKMGACQMTSRIVQLTIAIQTFVDRCFLGFEPEVSPAMAADSLWDQWKWMKAYRLWEANRKVFLFPENWVEPELRRDKSFAFKELEDELLQSEMTEDSARDAFLNYIDKLDQVANLDVTGVHWQDGEGRGRGAFHVVGRTAGQEPHAYFYRRFEHPSERWTPWSKVELDLKSAPVVPFMYDRRTFLVWPEFREQKPPTGPSISIPAGGGGTASVERPRYAVGVALSELRNGRWTPKKVSAEMMPSVDQPEIQEMLAWSPVDLRRVAGDGRFYFQDIDARYYANQAKVYEFLGCRGYPERASRHIFAQTVTFHNMQLRAARNVEHGDANVNELIASGTSTYAGSTMILAATPDRVKITYPHHFNSFDLHFQQTMRTLAKLWGINLATGRGDLSFVLGTRAPWIFADKGQTYFVEPVSAFPDGRLLTGSEILDQWREGMEDVPLFLRPYVQIFLEYALWDDWTLRLRFSIFYHPQVCAFREALLEGGVGKLLSRPTQFARGDLDFNARYAPVDGVVLRDDQNGNPVYHPVEDVDFSPRGAYSQYNWELFYHAPFLVGTQLMKAGRHEEAMGWFRHIFDPAGADGRHPVTGAPLATGDRRRFWITRPFFEREEAGYAAQRIDSILRLLAADPSGPGVDVAARDELIRQVATWRDNPFDPHLVAASRDVAYQKAAFIRFVENLVAWGDKLFAGSAIESVMAGGALYLYAKSFIGEMPEVVPPRGRPRSRTYAEIEGDIDAFGNALVAVEDLLPAMPPIGPPQSGPALPSVLHFCIPRNEKLLALWDLVDDRVRKYQNCLDLLGQPRKTSLFAPPIDPAAAIAAMMAGASAGDLLADISAPLPPYRFQTYLQKANELAGDLKAFAGALLSALEKRDGEALALLRQTQEIKLLDAARALKVNAIKEAESNVANLELAREMARIRNKFYSTREFMNAGETAAIGLNSASLVISAGAAVADTLGGVLAAIPNFAAGASGFGGSPHVAVTTGGMSFSRAMELAAKALTQAAGIVDKTAGIVSTVAGYQRRFEDWQMQASTSAKEIEQYGVQIAAANIRVENARRELVNHDLQMENSKSIDEFMRSKYTNRELYAWMAGEIGKTFFETFKLAYSHAKLAERCYRFDHGLTSSSLIGFGAWDSAHKGLQAGERLQLDLRRLDSAYLAANRRTFELTKNVSLAVAAPLALVELRRTGRCQVDLPEELFDLDYPGHYFRRIKSVSVSIPCVAGPNTTIACTLRLLRNAIRTNTQLPGGAAGYPRRMQNGEPLEDGRFRDEQVPVAAIATSSGQNDSGMFELSLRDERFLPFEGAGAVSRWSIELMEDETLRAFDHDSIADVILQMRYTSREEGGAFRTASMANLRNQLVAAQSRLEMRRVFRLSSDFANSWSAFRNPAPGSAPELQIHLDRSRFPGGDDRLVKLRSVQLMTEYPMTAAGSEPDLEWEIGAPPLGAAAIEPLVVDPDDTRYAESGIITFGPATLGAAGADWSFRFRENGDIFDSFDPETLADAYLIVGYSVQPAAP